MLYWMHGFAFKSCCKTYGRVPLPDKNPLMRVSDAITHHAFFCLCFSFRSNPWSHLYRYFGGLEFPMDSSSALDYGQEACHFLSISAQSRYHCSHDPASQKSVDCFYIIFRYTLYIDIWRQACLALARKASIGLIWLIKICRSLHTHWIIGTTWTVDSTSWSGPAAKLWFCRGWQQNWKRTQADPPGWCETIDPYFVHTAQLVP